MKGSDDLDLWAARLDVADTDVDRYRSTLDDRELARVDRLRRDVDKRDYIVSHGMLRSILASYAGVAPVEIAFRYGPFGKPYIGDAGPDRIEFNMSDSGGLLLVAVARGVAVGVDIEQHREIDVVKFAQRFFTVEEADALANLPESQRDVAFFRTWTCKEAYVKGWGFGIQRHVGRFQVRVGENRSGLVSCAFDEESPKRWSLVDIDGIDGYSATFAVERPDVEHIELKWWPLPPPPP